MIEAEHLEDSDFRKKIAKESHISYETVTKVIKAMTKILIETISDGGSVKIRGLGIFKAYTRPPGNVQNLVYVNKRGEVPSPYRAIKFTASLRTKNVIKKGYRVEENFDDEEL